MLQKLVTIRTLFYLSCHISTYQSAPYRAEEDEFFIQRNDDEEYQNTRSKYFDEPMDCGRERIRSVDCHFSLCPKP